MTTALQTLTNKLAQRFEIGVSDSLPQTLMATAFKGQRVSEDQMTALLIVANQHGLNPWTNEIYAFPSNGAIIPIVGVDGWARIMNDHPQFDGIEFEQDNDGCTCKIYRKDRSRPVVVTEYMAECQRTTQPWKSHPKRMLRHKAMIQCARLAFGFTGIYDQDEAERIAENNKEPINVTPKPTIIEAQAIEYINQDEIEQIMQLVDITNSNLNGLLAACGAESIEKISKPNFEKVMEKLKQKLARQEQQSNNNLGEDIPL